MDQSQLNIPPEALAALQQQQGGGMNITAILAQLSEMSPAEVSEALAQLGINVEPGQLQKAAEDWVDAAGDKQVSGGNVEGGADAAAAEGDDGEGMSPPSPQAPSAPSMQGVEAQEGEDPNSGMNEFDEGEGDAEGGDVSSTPTPVGGSSGGMPSGSPAMRPGANMQGAGGMPRGGAGGGGPGGGNMDALISQALSRGDPASMPPAMRGPGAMSGPQMRGPAMPGAGTPGPAAGDPAQMRAMIANIYKQTAGVSRQGAPTGPRGAEVSAAPPNPYAKGSRKRNA